MAVPKKRRIGYKLLNKGFDRRYWISLSLNRFFFKLAISQLRPLILINSLAKLRAPLRTHSYLLVFWRCLLKQAILQKKGKLRKITYRCTLSPLLTLLPRKKPFKFKPWLIDQNKPYPRSPFLVKPSCRLQFKAPLTGCLNTNLYNPPFSFSPKCLSAHPMTLTQYFLTCRKQAYALIQTPHYWGTQRHLLFHKWQEAPLYVYNFSPQARIFWLSARLSGFQVLNTPRNLFWPKGPSFKDLYAYIKSNPNEGYWMYCLLLQIFKKWQRWVRFPKVYLLRRNLWRQQKLTTVFIQNINEHYKLYPFAFKKHQPVRPLPLNFKLAKSPITCLGIKWLLWIKQPRTPHLPKTLKTVFNIVLMHSYRNFYSAYALLIKTILNPFK